MNTKIIEVTPIISVVMSVYNGEKYLNEAIDSVLNQTFKNFEFIIINDGSTDKSFQIIDSYKDSRIKLINNDGNKGLIYSLNKGIELATGEYIARMDADDISLPSRFEEQLNYLNLNKNCGVVSCNYLQFNENKEINCIESSNHNLILGFMLFNSSVVHPSLMIRKVFLDNLSIVFNPLYKHAEDYELWSRLIFSTRFSSVSKTLFKYRLHNEQVTSVHNIEQRKSADLIRENILKNAGFVFTKSELNIHCKIGSSEFLKEFNDLIDAEKWLKSLLYQNKNIKKIDLFDFNKVISKQWIDTCGNTNIGLKAFLFYFKSDLSKLANENKTKLLLKCIFRKFKQ